MATTMHDNRQLSNFLFDFGHDPRILGRLKLPYKTFNFLSLLARGVGVEKYDRAVDLIELCQWMYFHVSDVRNIINRLSEYAITDVQIDDTHTKLNKEQQETLERTLSLIGLKYKLIEAAKHFFATGNVMISVETNFKKHLKCANPECEKYSAPIDRINYTFDKATQRYISICPICKFKGPMTVLDIPRRSPNNIYIKIWDWHDIEFSYNPITEDYRYYYKIPRTLERKFTRGKPDKHLIETTPHHILKEIYSKKKNTGFADIKGKVVAFNPGKIKHIKNNSVNSAVMGGWGEPAITPVLQDTFFMLLLRQAQGIFLADYIVPMRIVSPDPKVAEMMDLNHFRTEFDRSWESFLRDPMQIMKFPFPIQYQTISGEARHLFMSNEMDYTRQAIRRGMGVPAELLDGGMQNFSGGSISLRMLENYFTNFLNSTIVELVNNFIIPNICIILGIPPFIANFVKFKMIDDVQQKQTTLDLYDRNIVTDLDLYEQHGKDRPSETELLQSIERKAKRDGLYQKTLASYQAEAQGILSDHAVSDQLKAQEMQAKDQKLQEAKGFGEGDAVNPEDVKEKKTEGNKPQVQTVQGNTLPPAEELGDYAVNQLRTPEERDNFIDELGRSLPNQEKYVKEVKKYMGDATAAELQQQTPIPPDIEGPSVEASKKKKGGKADMRPLPEQKPQQRQSQV